MEQELENRILTILTLLAIGSAIILTMLLGGCASSDPMAKYRRGAEKREYNARIKNNNTFSLVSYKDDNRSLKDEARDAKKNNSQRDKINRILRENEELRKQIEELKKKN